MVKKRQEEWKERLEGMGNERCSRECSKVLWRGKGSEEDLDYNGWKFQLVHLDQICSCFTSTPFNGLGSCT